MATIKNCTDLEQSRKLSEFLSIESADMHYNNVSIKGINYVDEHRAELMEYNRAINVLSKYTINPLFEVIPCWSLAALLNVIPYTIYKSDNEFYRLGIDKGYDDYAVWYDNNGFTITDLDVTSDNFVDACVDMIIKLHEQKLL